MDAAELMLEALANLAHVLAGQGAAAQAAELAAMVLAHPACSAWTRPDAEAAMDMAAAALPVGEFEAAKQRGQSLSLDETARAMIA